MKRIVLVINKSWEADAVFAALFNPDFKTFPPKYADLYKDITIENIHYPWDNKLQGCAEPAVIYTKHDRQVEIWCLNEVMTPPAKDNTDGFYFSRAFYKAKDMKKIVGYSDMPIDMLIAYGTAGAPTEVSKNGNIVIGSNIFPYDARLAPENLLYVNNKMDQLIPSGISQDFFDRLNLGLSAIELRVFFETAMLTPPINPATAFQIFADRSIVAVGDINVNSYADFDAGDKAALAAYKVLPGSTNQLAYSVETTHAVIRLEGECDNFMFISAITDRDAYFDFEVTPKSHAQNFSAAFNGGIFLNWFLPFLLNY
jgi:hypothetical protein